MAYDFDILPESSYDPATGEYSTFLDFTPVPVQDVRLTGDVHATIFSIGDENEALRIADLLQSLANVGVFEAIVDVNNPNNYAELNPTIDIANKKTVRGPFLTWQEVEKFLNRTGLRGVGVPLYDKANNVFYIDIDTDLITSGDNVPHFSEEPEE